MGGKDAMIVDSEANLDEAVEAVVSSTFGYQGQKCSACSRAIVDESLYDEFLEKLVERTRKITMGEVENPDHLMGAVINKSAQEKALKYIESGKKDGRLLHGGQAGSDSGYFVQPTIIADIDSKDQLAQEEVFAPVLAVIKARDFDHALEIANDTEFGLTGAVYSENTEKLKKARNIFQMSKKLWVI